MTGGIFHWPSKLQATVALSTAEAETIAATEAAKQVIIMRLFHEELGSKQEGRKRLSARFKKKPRAPGFGRFGPFSL